MDSRKFDRCYDEDPSGLQLFGGKARLVISNLNFYSQPEAADGGIFTSKLDGNYRYFIPPNDFPHRTLAMVSEALQRRCFTRN